MPDRPVILTGFMGSGKSSVGRVLARKLSCRFVDLDSEIVAVSGCSISEIFARDGEAAFRLLESKQLEQILSQGDGIVIASGGGAVISEHNRRLMRKRAFTVNLRVTLEQVLTRLHGCNNRPLLAGDRAPERVKALMDEREQFYADADIQIDTDGKSVEDVAMEILGCLHRLSA
ncbi:MAG: shikimate kinase [Deltaproteobacteria bacterium]|nr:shikimate kinase [Deltaproteobacteria bacterium]